MARRIQEETARENAPLSARLSEYSAIAHTWHGAKSLHRRTGNWPIYAAATGSALAMATGASASIISEVYGPGVSVSLQGVGKSSIKGLAIGSGEINIKAISAASFAELELQPIRMHIFDTGTGSGSAVNFALHSQIGGPHKGPGSAIVKAFFSTASPPLFGKFQSGVPGFAGLSMTTAGSGHEYGWLELEFTEDSNGVPDVLQALAYGLDTTPGQAIAAGQTTPEPGTLALAILAAGAMGVEALRRRRRQA